MLLFQKGGIDMKDLLIFGGIVVFWYVLNRYILPKMGVQT